MILKPKILIVDDKLENIIALEQTLEELDADFVRALSGNEAVIKTMANDFALILIDVQMPDMDGFEAVEYILKEKKNKSIPVIFITAVYTDEMYKIKGVRSGGIDYIIKPVQEEILIGKVKLFLEINKKEQELYENNIQLELTRLQLQTAHDELEQRVEERTSELARKNIALKEVLDQIELEKNQFSQRVAINIDKLILPLIKRLKMKGSSLDKKYIEMVEHGLEDLVSSFGIKISDKNLCLTPRETEICNMIKEGFSSKEISGFLALSFGTIEVHRNNIRKKLQITNKNINLTSYLRQMS